MKKNSISLKCSVVCTARDASIVKLYLPNASIFSIDKDSLSLLGIYAQSCLCRDKRIKALIYPPFMRTHLSEFQLRSFAEVGEEMDVFYKYGCFNLDEKIAFEKPNLSGYVEEANKFIKNNGIRHGFVLLIPYTNSRIEVSRRYWEKIAKGLNDKGYAVYTNVDVRNRDEIEGTLPIAIPLEIIPLIIKKCGCVISSRCGLADWIFVNECNLIVLHAFKQGKSNVDDVVQSSFGRKESFVAMQKRCGLKGKLSEYRICIDRDYESVVVRNIISDVEQMDKRGFKDAP